jgi:hypothetical protein
MAKVPNPPAPINICRPYCCLALLCFIIIPGLSSDIYAQNEVDVFSYIDGEKVEGMATRIWMDKNGSVYVTARQLVWDTQAGNPAEDVKIQISENTPLIDAEVIKVAIGAEWAILRTNYPNFTEWQHNFTFRELKIAERVFIHSSKGDVILADPGNIKADIKLKSSQLLGASLLARGGVAGVVVDKEEHQISAIPISRIIAIAFRQLGIDPSQKFYNQALEHTFSGFGFPYVILGGYGQFNQPVPSGEFSPSLTSFSGEVFAEVSLFKPVAFRFSYGSWGVKSTTEEIQGELRQFRNRATTWSADLVFFSAYKLRPNFRDPYYGIIGYTQFISRPELRFDKGAWANLTDLNYINTKPGSSGSIKLGAGGTRTFNDFWVFSFEIGCFFPFSDNLIYRLQSPDTPTPRKEMIGYLKLGTGIHLGNKAKLRDD